MIASRSKLDCKMDYLVVRTSEKTSRIHLDEIAVLIIESTAVSLTAYLLAELTARKIKVIFCDEKHYPSSELVPYYGSHDTSRRIRDQLKWTEQARDFVWAEIVRGKLRGQVWVLSADHAEAAEKLEGYLREIVPGDATNREGHAAKVYFNALFGKGFSRSDECPVNASLDYGYSLLISAFAREIVACGYITPLGIHHGNTFNAFNLACDLVEPFRPYVDAAVVKMAPRQFGKEERATLANTLNHIVRIVGQEHRMLSAIHIYSVSIFNALAENDTERLKMPAYE